MKINITVDEKIKETQVDISCKMITPEIAQIISALRVLNKQITGKKNGEIYIIGIDEIYYLESIDRKCYAYTKNDVIETDFKLYELENKLSEYGFVRISKSCLIQIKYITSIRAEIGQKLRVTMNNSEQIIVSRFYAQELKKRLGVN